MSQSEPVLLIVREWLQKAENDLKTASHTLLLKRDCPTDTVCFHAQQAIEKFLKSLLVLAQVDFPRTHDVQKINSLLPRQLNLPLSAEQQRRLTTYATTARYPGSDEPISLAEARKAVALARRVRREVYRMVSSEVPTLRKKRRT